MANESELGKDDTQEDGVDHLYPELVEGNDYRDANSQSEQAAGHLDGVVRNTGGQAIPAGLPIAGAARYSLPSEWLVESATAASTNRRLAAMVGILRSML